MNDKKLKKSDDNDYREYIFKGRKNFVQQIFKSGVQIEDSLEVKFTGNFLYITSLYTPNDCIINFLSLG